MCGMPLFQLHYKTGIVFRLFTLRTPSVKPKLTDGLVSGATRQLTSFKYLPRQRRVDVWSPDMNLFCCGSPARHNPILTGFNTACLLFHLFQEAINLLIDLTGSRTGERN